MKKQRTLATDRLEWGITQELLARRTGKRLQKGTEREGGWHIGSLYRQLMGVCNELNLQMEQKVR